MVEQLEKYTTSFLYEEHSSNNTTGYEANIGNVDLPIHFANTIGDFHDLIKELKNQSLAILQRLETKMVEQAKAKA